LLNLFNKIALLTVAAACDSLLQIGGRERPMKRREFIGLVGGAFAAWPLRARGQPRRPPRLAILLFNSPQIDSIGPLLEGLQGFG
jgi:hypothetical protein